MERKRKSITPYQTQMLMKWFQVNPFLENEEKHQLAKSLNISEQRIQDWYRNKRYKRRQKGLLPKGEECSKKVLVSNVLNITCIKSIATIHYTHTQAQNIHTHAQNIHAHSHTHTQTHTHTHKHTHTNTQTHVRLPS